MAKHENFVDEAYSWIYERQRKLEEELLVNDNLQTVIDFQAELESLMPKVEERLDDLDHQVDEHRQELVSFKNSANVRLSQARLIYDKCREEVRNAKRQLEDYDREHNIHHEQDRTTRSQLRKLLRKLRELFKYPWHDCDHNVKIVYRLWSNIKVGQPTECWLWQGSKQGKFGTIFNDGDYDRAHEVMYHYHYGRFIKEAFVIGHSCSNHLCCNPEHLTRKLRLTFADKITTNYNDLNRQQLAHKYELPISIIDMVRKNKDKACGINLDQYKEPKLPPTRGSIDD